LYAEKLSKEVSLDFQRSMNKITFDKVIMQNPERFPFVLIEEGALEKVPSRGIILVYTTSCIEEHGSHYRNFNFFYSG